MTGKNIRCNMEEQKKLNGSEKTHAAQPPESPYTRRNIVIF